MALDRERSSKHRGQLQLAIAAVIWHRRCTGPRRCQGWAFPEQFFNQRPLQYHPFWANSNADGHTFGNSYTFGNANSYTFGDANANAYSYSYTNCHSDGYTDAY